MITDIKVQTKKKSNKEQIKRIKLWQLRLESLAEPTPNKALSNYNKELSNQVDNIFLKPTFEIISLHKKNKQF